MLKQEPSFSNLLDLLESVLLKEYLAHIKEAQRKTKQGMAEILFFQFYFAHSQKFLTKETLFSII